MTLDYRTVLEQLLSLQGQAYRGDDQAVSSNNSLSVTARTVVSGSGGAVTL